MYLQHVYLSLCCFFSVAFDTEYIMDNNDIKYMFIRSSNICLVHISDASLSSTHSIYICIYILYYINIGNWNVCGIKIMYNALYSSNTLAPWRCCSNCEGVISEHISRIKFAKPLPEPILIQVYVAIWLEQTTVCWTKVDLNDPLYTENPLYTEYLSYCN